MQRETKRYKDKEREIEGGGGMDKEKRVQRALQFYQMTKLDEMKPFFLMKPYCSSKLECDCHSLTCHFIVCKFKT